MILQVRVEDPPTAASAPRRYLGSVALVRREGRPMRLAEQIKKDAVAQLAWDDRVGASNVTVAVRGAAFLVGS